MNNQELEQILRAAPMPERSGEYWEQFPERVMEEIGRRQFKEKAAAPAATRTSGSPTAVSGQRGWLAIMLCRRAFAAGGCAVCLLVGLFLCIRTSWHASADPQLALARKCFSEVSELFPSQVQALVLDESGAHLLLAEHPNVPLSPPLYVRITGPIGEHRFVTFSGQRIRVNEDSFEVLIDGQGEVLLVGKQSVWSSSDPGNKAGRYRIEARPLLTNS